MFPLWWTPLQPATARYCILSSVKSRIAFTPGFHRTLIPIAAPIARRKPGTPPSHVTAAGRGLKIPPALPHKNSRRDPALAGWSFLCIARRSARGTRGTLAQTISTGTPLIFKTAWSSSFIRSHTTRRSGSSMSGWSISKSVLYPIT